MEANGRSDDQASVVVVQCSRQSLELGECRGPIPWPSAGASPAAHRRSLADFAFHEAGQAHGRPPRSLLNGEADVRSARHRPRSVVAWHRRSRTSQGWVCSTSSFHPWVRKRSSASGRSPGARAVLTSDAKNVGRRAPRHAAPLDGFVRSPRQGGRPSSGSTAQLDRRWPRAAEGSPTRACCAGCSARAAAFVSAASLSSSMAECGLPRSERAWSAPPRRQGRARDGGGPRHRQSDHPSCSPAEGAQRRRAST